MSITAEQRSRLLRAKLSSLVRDHRGEDGRATDAGPTDVGSLAAMVVRGVASVLVDDATPSSLAAALLWAHRQHADRLVLYSDHGAARLARLARLASYFDFGATPIEVRQVEGATSVAADAEPLPAPVDAPVVAEELIAQLHDAGLEVVTEHGVTRGEVLGLEVARLVCWPAEVGGDGELHLEAGVGRFDRDAVAAVHPDESPTDSLRRSVEAVRSHRYPGAPTHPLQMLARERWLRANLIADPALIAAAVLEAVAMTTEAAGLKDSHPAAAFGRDLEGEPLVVVCSTGADLGVVPLAADTRASCDAAARLVLAVPERDLHEVTVVLAGMLHEPADVVAVQMGWS